MQIYTVSQVNIYLKAVMDELPPIQHCYVSGEISNFKHYYQSGHMYFTLKDATSQLKCVMFASDSYKLKFKLENGMKVVCFGKIGVYDRDGVYQLYCHDMQPQGVGALQIAFEQMKERLSNEGLFDDIHKKPIPKYPKKIGVATSNMGAAVEDIKNVISRRYPLAEIIIVPTVVQGEAATNDIVKSIQLLDGLGDIDVIIVGRGGGSIEDLWAFNTEEVARAVFYCKTPIISAVGHETDTTICDFVADLRAPTPSAAAELAVPDIQNLKYNINNLSLQIEKAVDYKLETLENKLFSIINSPIINNRSRLFDNQIDKINSIKNQILASANHKVELAVNNISRLAYSINSSSPLSIMAKGYTLVQKDNMLVKSASELKFKDKITIKFSDGSVEAEIC